MMKIEFQVEFKLPNSLSQAEVNDFLRRAEHNLRTHYTHGPDLKTKYHPDVVRVAEVDFQNYDRP